jgi:hypothetical protein
MTLLIVIVALILFDLLALRFGFDSRNTRSAGLRSSWQRDIPK